jgi:hypothetical protein
MRGTAIEGQALDAAMHRVQDLASRRLVGAVRLHADKAVLDEVEPTDPVPAANLIQPRELRSARPGLAAERDRIASPCLWRAIRI